MGEETLNPLEHWLTYCWQHQASDLLLVADSPPQMYVHGLLTPLDAPPLSATRIEQCLMPTLSDEQQTTLQQNQDLDYVWPCPGSGYCRINLHRQRQSWAAAIRFIRSEIPSIEQLRLPDILHEFAQLSGGLILIAGATGQGKSTTLAAMIQYVNRHFARHIITLEDPIEYTFTHHKSLIEQREIGSDSPGFAMALRHILRQKPDVIMIGEMRDRETMSAALTAAQTGQLVLATVHANSASTVVERIVNSFEGSAQYQIRIQLAQTLQAVISQALLRDTTGRQMLPVCEVLVATSAVRRAIRDNETYLIPGLIETGGRVGMQTFEYAVQDWVRQGCLSPQEAAIWLHSLKPLEGTREVTVPSTMNVVLPSPAATASMLRS